MISDFPVMVDACVLVQAAVRDILLRLFERRLFLARWTDEIIEETVRTLRDKLGRTQEQTDYLVNCCAIIFLTPGLSSVIGS